MSDDRIDEIEAAAAKAGLPFQPIIVHNPDGSRALLSDTPESGIPIGGGDRVLKADRQFPRGITPTLFVGLRSHPNIPTVHMDNPADAVAAINARTAVRVDTMNMARDILRRLGLSESEIRWQTSRPRSVDMTGFPTP